MIPAGRAWRLPLALFFLGSSGAWSAIPLTVNHQGVVTVNGAPFTGTGLFRFALIDPISGLNLWTNDGSTDGAANMPTNAVEVPVTNGLYSVGLGDATLTNMVPLPSTVFDTDNLRLRVWFDDGVNGALRLEPDQPLTSAPYAFHAARSESADVATTSLDHLPSGLRVLGESATPPVGFTFTGQRIDSAGGTWRPKAPMPEMTSGSSAVTLNDQIHVFAGGHRAYDPVTDSWTTLTNYPTPRFEAAAAAVNGKIYVIGGRVGATTDVNEVYDPAMDSWAPMASMPQPSARSAVGVIDGKIHVVSGYTYNGVFNPIPNHQVFDPELNTWSTAAGLIDVYSAAYSGSYHGAVVGGKMYVFAAEVPHEYDPATDMWTAKAPAPGHVRAYYSFAEIAGRMFLISGISQVSFQIVGTVQEYDPVSDTWSEHIPIPKTRYYASGAGSLGKVYVIGGAGDNVGSSDNNQEFSPSPVNYVHQKD
ncbi:MAG: N-acetylneuraminate epimerase [bacterium]|nr:N-acetylneuraminate epimerase [bacterium]